MRRTSLWHRYGESTFKLEAIRSNLTAPRPAFTLLTRRGGRVKTFALPGGAPERKDVVALPSESYDHVWSKGGERSAVNAFLSSDQCLGCHSAGGTGLQYDMTEPGPDNKLINISPYGTWRGSPMALAGRDPIFFSQLASETQTFHPQSAPLVEDTCFGLSRPRAAPTMPASLSIRKAKLVAGELWWKDDCSVRIDPLARPHQPHYRTIGRHDQVQIFEKLSAAPAAAGAPACGVGAKPSGPLTTSFLSMCARVKDNRLLPQGFLGLDKRKRIAAALGADADLADDTSAVGVGDDPSYAAGGGDSIVYRAPIAEFGGKKPAALQATLYYQPTPPCFLQTAFAPRAATTRTGFITWPASCPWRERRCNHRAVAAARC